MAGLKMFSVCNQNSFRLLDLSKIVKIIIFKIAWGGNLENLHQKES